MFPLVGVRALSIPHPQESSRQEGFITSKRGINATCTQVIQVYVVYMYKTGTSWYDQYTYVNAEDGRRESGSVGMRCYDLLWQH